MPVDILTPPRTMLEVYESLPEGTPVQLIQNKLITSPSSFTNHQRILMNLSFQMKIFVEENALGEVL